MGIRDNFNKISEYWKTKNFESKMAGRVVKQTIVETNFYEKYSSFVAGLSQKLDDLLVTDGNSEIVFRPNNPELSKYFERAMQDHQFSALYDIKRTKGGEYSFKQKTLMDKVDLEDFR